MKRAGGGRAKRSRRCSRARTSAVAKSEEPLAHNLTKRKRAVRYPPPPVMTTAHAVHLVTQCRKRHRFDSPERVLASRFLSATMPAAKPKK